MRIRVILLLVLLALALVILLQNTAVCAFHVLFWQLEMSLIVLVLLLLCIGFLLGLLVPPIVRRRSRKGAPPKDARP
ncbi:MAG: DUF1049 domain-containing protein [Candidatus Eisenbacteria bacterium]|nr:DUF1049 domain-containing protein [Candidatus Eisenbacteria bacterium]